MTTECSIEGCARLHFARSWCRYHYMRWHKYGHPQGLPLKQPRNRSEAERFWAKVDTSGGPEACWPWTGFRSPPGYGRFRRGGRSGHALAAHRVGYELQVGPIPDGLEIDHLCRNRACQNARHLEPVTHVENLRRGRDRAQGAHS